MSGGAVSLSRRIAGRDLEKPTYQGFGFWYVHQPSSTVIPYVGMTFSWLLKPVNAEVYVMALKSKSLPPSFIFTVLFIQNFWRLPFVWYCKRCLWLTCFSPIFSWPESGHNIWTKPICDFIEVMLWEGLKWDGAFKSTITDVPFVIDE